MRSAFALGLVIACGAPPHSATESRGPASPLQATAERLVGRWNDGAPLSTHPVTLVSHCVDSARMPPEMVEPNVLTAKVAQPLGRVAACADRCCDIVNDLRRGGVSVRKLCFDDQDQLDQVHLDGRCRGD